MTTQAPDQPKAEEVSLEDIDKLLEAEDPEFTKQLEEVRSVEVDKSIEIESAVSDDDGLGAEAQTEAKPETKFGKFKLWLKTALGNLKTRIRSRMILAWKDLIIFLKTRPKEFLFYAISIAKVLAQKIQIPIKSFFQASRLQQLTVLVLFAMLAGMGWILKSNLKGIWIPSLNEPLLTSFENHADFAETYDAKDGGESFYTAFPQERHEFLFRKLKVNLKSAPDSPNPMGAFEVIVQVDSKDTAIEIGDREVELFDALQRVFEEETFNDLETEIGKAKLKGRIKRELNQKLTQGWIKEVTFKTFILKP